MRHVRWSQPKPTFSGITARTYKLRLERVQPCFTATITSPFDGGDAYAVLYLTSQTDQPETEETVP